MIMPQHHREPVLMDQNCQMGVRKLNWLWPATLMISINMGKSNNKKYDVIYFMYWEENLIFHTDSDISNARWCHEMGRFSELLFFVGRIHWLNENCFLIPIAQIFFPKGSMDIKSSLVQIMALHEQVTNLYLNPRWFILLIHVIVIEWHVKLMVFFNENQTKSGFHMKGSTYYLNILYESQTKIVCTWK